ncbi:WHG domain-containing protein [Devosia sp. BK]|nr:WHG domain-containing protein [Devosia sp. BK]
MSRERLIEAAIALTEADGFVALNLAALARGFGVKLASLYAHVRNVDDLKAEVALNALRRLADMVDEAIAGRAGRDALYAYAEAQRDFALVHPGLFEAARHPLSEEIAMQSAGVRIARASRAVFRSYALDDADQVHATRLLGSFLLGFVLLDRSGSFAHSEPEAAESWARGLASLHMTISGWAEKDSEQWQSWRSKPR